MSTSETPHDDHSALASLDGAPIWLNSEPLTADGLRGRVVLVDFWTYSCVNWLRTLPYVRAWAKRYRDRGLVVVGVHAPEFGFEHDLGNVRRAVSELDVGYPVVIDNDFTIWRSFENHYWPAVYLVDGGGRVRFHHFGEEAYEETERTIQQLLGVDEELVRVDAGGLAEAADWAALRSPETYVGYARGERRSDRRADGLALNQWALTGEWSVGEEAAVLEAAAGSIAYRFEARDLNLVLAPPESGAPVSFTSLLDGQSPGDDHGLDVEESGEGTLSEPRMYQLVRRRGPIRERTFEIRFLDPGVRAYVFTFG
jgi:thiol-disulfide isomerase/thioredoxin